MAERGAQIYYKILTDDNIRPNCCDKWENKFGEVIKYNIVFKKIQNIKEIKLRWFQLRLIHRILATNVVLHGMGIKDTDVCSFCKQVKDSLQHMFWDCDIVGHFWQLFQTTINTICTQTNSIELNQQIIFFGYKENFRTVKIFDLILLHAKL